MDYYQREPMQVVLVSLFGFGTSLLLFLPVYSVLVLPFAVLVAKARKRAWKFRSVFRIALGLAVIHSLAGVFLSWQDYISTSPKKEVVAPNDVPESKWREESRKLQLASYLERTVGNSVADLRILEPVMKEGVLSPETHRAWQQAINGYSQAQVAALKEYVTSGPVANRLFWVDAASSLRGGAVLSSPERTRFEEYLLAQGLLTSDVRSERDERLKRLAATRTYQEASGEELSIDEEFCGNMASYYAKLEELVVRAFDPSRLGESLRIE